MTSRQFAIIMALCFSSSSALAEEVLYCTDTGAVGFKWDKGVASLGRVARERFTVKVVSGTQRIITRMAGDTAGEASQYICKQPYPSIHPEALVCDDERSTEPWRFYHSGYVRAFLFGPPAGGIDPNIWIAYGTCTKF
jgi:hypothetical protein